MLFLRSRGEHLIFLSCFSFFLAPANDLQQLVRLYTTSAQNELAVINVMSVSGRLLSQQKAVSSFMLSRTPKTKLMCLNSFNPFEGSLKAMLKQPAAFIITFSF